MAWFMQGLRADLMLCGTILWLLKSSHCQRVCSQSLGHAAGIMQYCGQHSNQQYNCHTRC